jgi:hypothetical protein
VFLPGPVKLFGKLEEAMKLVLRDVHVMILVDFLSLRNPPSNFCMSVMSVMAARPSQSGHARQVEWFNGGTAAQAHIRDKEWGDC